MALAPTKTVMSEKLASHASSHSWKFFREPLKQASDIRLLQILPGEEKDDICCIFYNTDLSADFDCLSYCWNPTNNQSKFPWLTQILLNGQPYYIRHNLWEFMVCARRQNWRRPLWIDAVCIDQDNLKEKAQQVSMMGEIYATAQKVIVWLDVIENDDSIAFDRFVALTRSCTREAQILDRTPPSGCSSACPWYQVQAIMTDEQTLQYKWSNVPPAYCQIHLKFKRELEHSVILKIQHARYWSRAWIMQELNLAREIHLLTESGLADLRELWPMLKAHHMFYLPQIPYEEKKNYHLGSIFLHDRTRNSTSPMWIFSHSLGLLNGKGCKDWHDRLFSILPLFKEWRSFRINYQSTREELAWSAMDFCFRCYKTDFISMDSLMEHGQVFPALCNILYRDECNPQLIHESYLRYVTSASLSFRAPTLRDRCYWTVIHHKVWLCNQMNPIINGDLPSHRHRALFGSFSVLGETLMLIWIADDVFEGDVGLNPAGIQGFPRLIDTAVYAFRQNSWVVLKSPPILCEHTRGFSAIHKRVQEGDTAGIQSELLFT